LEGIIRQAGGVIWSHLLTLACALLLLPALALAGAKEKVAALAPSVLVLVIDEKGNELGRVDIHRIQIMQAATATKDA